MISRLLLELIAYGRDDVDDTEANAAFEAAVAANWHACSLLAVTSGGESPIPENIIRELREQRLDALKRVDQWPGAGGVQEGMLLSEQFSGFAGCEEAEEEAWHECAHHPSPCAWHGCAPHPLTLGSNLHTCRVRGGVRRDQDCHIVWQPRRGGDLAVSEAARKYSAEGGRRGVCACYVHDGCA